jgi:peptidylprolyl isomerase
MFKATTLTNSLRSTINTTFTPSLTRSFHASSANMAIKTYFDCQWTGPQITVDDNGKVISKDDSVARKSHPTI